MLTILEILRKTTDFFSKKGIPNPRLEAEWIIAHGLGVDRLNLYLQFDRVLTEPEVQKLRAMTVRRGNREPLQYIIGEVDFCDIRLKVDKRALIPRPETEELVTLLTEKELANAPKRILDLGCGTGAIAIALAKNFPDAEVVAIDASPDSLALAKENAALNGLEKRVSFVLSDWFQEVSGLFDCIVSNPPYLTENEWRTAQPEVKDFEPYSALVANQEGLADLANILRRAPAYLTEGGLLIMETGIAHHAELLQLAKTIGYTDTKSLKDDQQRARFFLARK
ncbi:MAG: peptide chain release factor N(5)-glutamine methyltransferase [Verrucomicrobia bacterium CG_4_10_14_3_um_filter_43_23]|nr:MAG: protein-(glutamine-N5) methyltransferase, release factor-specific [Verrucomicrobia bacterium CG22_combo_CG10-13_8_21_14_all_43_17]PIX58982.1 MAG: peptide chain release factor N(5)-glutamine methyltransferase [Verrucomicrobia bacterium CG_4_10_14_3_um_filter_43_23]PIY62756.1 MAG: peptide chain release factor N(5)-glutamine methyltransferase [Verrucomicrobia bacterium CG_4_10_14_0_8_um_filter_43_34]PJA44054.1 MAG: peptide chain release factor N(5)-glutamine methyltransferase [Verrucomicrob